MTHYKAYQFRGNSPQDNYAVVEMTPVQMKEFGEAMIAIASQGIGQMMIGNDENVVVIKVKEKASDLKTEVASQPSG